MGTEPTNGASNPAMIPPTTIRTSRRAAIATIVISKPKISFGTISNPPKRIHHAQSHGSKTRQKAADKAYKESRHEPSEQDGRGQNENWHNAAQRAAKERNRHESQSKAKKSAHDSNHQRLAKNKAEDLAVRETNGFQHGKLARTLANRDGHGIAGHKKQREKDDGADGDDQKLDVAELFNPACREGRLGFCLRFVRRIREFGIDGLGDARSVIRIVDP